MSDRLWRPGAHTSRIVREAMCAAHSADGDAWSCLAYDKSRAKAYRWGEDGIAGICDRYQLLCFAPAFWNERDAHLKERLFGVNPREGNHGEDVKEYYFHVDNTPTHSYMCLLYKYPQAAYPYAQLVSENQRRAGQGPEYELLDTGVFDGDRYFDIFIEYAKASEDDLAIRITAHNRGPDAAPLHILPTLWFRNTWGWGKTAQPEPTITASTAGLVADDGPKYAIDPRLTTTRGSAGELSTARGRNLLFTDNETNGADVYGPGNVSRTPHTKDAFHRYLCARELAATRTDNRGTKAAFHVRELVPAGGTMTVRVRLTDRELADPLAEVDAIVATRKAEADIFYDQLAPAGAGADEKLVQRRALAGLLWTKQSYVFDVATWLDGDNPDYPPPAVRRMGRNAHWRNLNSMRVMSMPDKWEYPWFAAWDLAFQCVPFALVDPKFAKDQLWMLLFEQFQHPGEDNSPAYEWDFPAISARPFRVGRVDLQHGAGAPKALTSACGSSAASTSCSSLRELGQQGRPRQQQRVRGRLPRPRQHHRDRSQRAVARRLRPRAIRRDRLDGHVLPEPHADLARARTRDNPVYERMATKFTQHYAHRRAMR